MDKQDPSMGSEAFDVVDIIASSEAAMVPRGQGQAGRAGAELRLKPWEDPEPLMAEEMQPSPWPIIALPSPLGGFINAVAAHTQTDPAMAGCLVLGALAGACQGAYEIESLRGNHEQLSIYGVAIAEPSERKSAVLKIIAEPVQAYENLYNALNAEAILDSQAQKAMLEKVYEQRLKEYEKAIKGAQPSDLEELGDKVKSAKRELGEYKELKPATLILGSDTTPEALAMLMADNKARMFVADAEGALFGNMKGRYSTGSDGMELYLKAHSGDMAKIRRVSRPPVDIPKPAISLCLTIQPYILNKLISDDENNGRGLCARLALAFCEKLAGGRSSEPCPIPEHIHNEHNAAITQMLDYSMAVPEGEARLLRMGSEAHERFCAYNDTTAEPQIITGIREMDAWYGKRLGLAVRIAGLFHCYKCAIGGINPETVLVARDTAVRAMAVADALTQHAEKAFLVPDWLAKDAEYLLKRITKLMGKTERAMAKSALQQSTRKRFANNPRDFGEALKLLEARKHIQIAKAPSASGKGKQADIVVLNPKVII